GTGCHGQSLLLQGDSGASREAEGRSWDAGPVRRRRCVARRRNFGRVIIPTERRVFPAPWSAIPSTETKERRHARRALDGGRRRAGRGGRGLSCYRDKAAAGIDPPRVFTSRS